MRTKMLERSLDWWLERTENHREVADGYMVLCPAHNDRNPSLHLTVDSRGVIAHCLAGCSYNQVLAALSHLRINTVTTDEEETPNPPPQGLTEDSVRAWWEEYTGIPDLVWESWGVKFTGGTVDFTWPNVPVKKKRRVRSKDFSWYPKQGAAPPFWPSMNEELPERIYILSGETDCGVLRFCDFDAFCLTKGESYKGSAQVWQSLYKRGVREVIFGLDDDEAGERGTNRLSVEARAAKMAVGRIFVGDLIDPLLGEKDLRDVWLRVKDPKEMTPLVDSVTEVEEPPADRRVNILDFLSSNTPSQQWLIDRMILKNTIHLIIGPPKMMKTWLALDCGVSIATNRPFLGNYSVGTPGRVVYISKEDPDYLLHDRLGKILTGKGLGGRIEENRVVLPPVGRRIPFEVDLNRSFYFTEGYTNELIDWVWEMGGAEAIIFDPILRMIPEGVDEFKAGEIERSIFKSSERLRSETGAAVILVHHKAKSAGEKTSYGSIGFRAFGEGFWYLLGDGPDTEGFIQVQNEYKSAPELTWEYRFDDLEYRYSVEAHEKSVGRGDRPDVIRDLVLHRLESIYPDGMTVNEMVRIFNGPTDFQLREALSRLEDTGDVAREKAPDTGGKRGKRQDVWSYKDKSA